MIDIGTIRLIKSSAQWEWALRDVLERRLAHRCSWKEAARQTRQQLTAFCNQDEDDVDPEQLRFLAGNAFPAADADSFAAEQLVRLLTETHRETVDIGRRLRAMT